MEAVSNAVMPAHSKNVSRYTPAYIGAGLDVIFGLDPAAPAGPYPMLPFVRHTYALERGEDGLEATRAR